MKQEKLLYMSLKALRAEFEKLFPDLCHIAQICADCHTFVNEFSTWLRLCHKSSLTHETVKHGIFFYIARGNVLKSFLQELKCTFQQ